MPFQVLQLAAVHTKVPGYGFISPVCLHRSLHSLCHRCRWRCRRPLPQLPRPLLLLPRPALRSRKRTSLPSSEPLELLECQCIAVPYVLQSCRAASLARDGMQFLFFIAILLAEPIRCYTCIAHVLPIFSVGFPSACPASHPLIPQLFGCSMGPHFAKSSRRAVHRLSTVTAECQAIKS